MQIWSRNHFSAAETNVALLRVSARLRDRFYRRVPLDRPLTCTSPSFEHAQKLYLSQYAGDDELLFEWFYQFISLSNPHFFFFFYKKQKRCYYFLIRSIQSRSNLFVLFFPWVYIYLLSRNSDIRVFLYSSISVSFCVNSSVFFFFFLFDSFIYFI